MDSFYFQAVATIRSLTVLIRDASMLIAYYDQRIYKIFPSDALKTFTQPVINQIQKPTMSNIFGVSPT